MAVHKQVVQQVGMVSYILWTCLIQNACLNGNIMCTLQMKDVQTQCRDESGCCDWKKVIFV